MAVSILCVLTQWNYLILCRVLVWKLNYKSPGLMFTHPSLRAFNFPFSGWIFVDCRGKACTLFWDQRCGSESSRRNSVPLSRSLLFVRCVTDIKPWMKKLQRNMSRMSEYRMWWEENRKYGKMRKSVHWEVMSVNRKGLLWRVTSQRDLIINS